MSGGDGVQLVNAEAGAISEDEAPHTAHPGGEPAVVCEAACRMLELE
jgi:hypothetical protein